MEKAKYVYLRNADKNINYLDKFRPIQVVIKGDFNGAVKAFKAMVQRDKVLSIYKQKQAYEKPSEKKRRKRRESLERRMAIQNKLRLMDED